MTTKRRRRSRQSGVVSDAVWHLLETGRGPTRGVFSTWFDAFELEFGPEAERQRVWESVKTELLAEWIQRRPGTRPYAWWEFEAPAPRVEFRDGRYESEAGYLRRHRLLVAGEHGRLVPRDFESVLLLTSWDWDTQPPADSIEGD